MNAASWQRRRRRRRSVVRYADARDLAYGGVAVVASVISGANKPAQLIIFGKILDSFNEISIARAVRLVQYFALLYAIIGVQQFVSITVQATAATRVAAALARKIRAAYVGALLAKPIAWFDAESRASSLLLESTLAIEDGLGAKLATGIQGASAFALGIAASLYYAWSLTVVTVSILPVVAGVLALTSRVRSMVDRAASDTQQRAAATAFETLSRIRTVAAFNGEKRALEMYETATKDVASINVRLAMATGVNSAAVAACLYATWALGLWYGAYLIRRDLDECGRTTEAAAAAKKSCVTGGQVMTAFLCVVFGGLSLHKNTLPAVAAFDAARLAVNRVFDVIDDDDDDEVVVVVVEGVDLQLERAPSIVFEGVHFAYPSRPDRDVFSSGLDLALEAGKSTALVGRSGSGKTTVGSLLLRFYEPTSGRILIDGVNIATLSPSSLRARFGLVSQEPALFAGSVADNIRYGHPAAASYDDIVAAAKLANAHDFVMALPDGYDTRVDDDDELSGGQKQRLAIARAFAREPRILILDEATSALDAKSEKLVQEALQRLIGDQTTALVIAHRLSTVRECDVIVVLGDGKVLERGTHDELMHQEDCGHYYALVTAQLLGGGRRSEREVVADNTPELPIFSEEEEVRFDDENENDAVDLNVVVVDVEGKAVETSTKEAIVKWVWGMAAGERAALAAGLAGSATCGFAQPLVGFLMAEFCAVFFETSKRAMARKSTFWALMFVCLGGGAAVGEVAKAWGLGRIREKARAAARSSTFEAMIRQDVGWHDAKSAGALVTQLATDCAAVTVLVGQRLGQTLAMGFILVCGLAISFDASWRLTLLTLGIIPLILLPIIASVPSCRRRRNDDDDAAAAADLRAAGALASNALAEIRTVRALDLRAEIAADFDSRLERPEKAAIDRGFARGLGCGIAKMCILLGASYQYYVASIAYRRGLVGFDDVMTVLLVVMFVALGLSAALESSPQNTDKASALRAGKRLRNICSRRSKLDPFLFDGDNNLPKAAKTPPPPPLRLEFRDVEFAYPSRPCHAVLKRFSFVVSPGETVALCGASGSGKSTVVNLLLRFYDPNAGRVLLDGVDARTMAVGSLRTQFGVVSQEPMLFAGSAAENIAYGKTDATRDEIVEAAKLAEAHGFISALPRAYETRVGDFDLSGGQKQRVALARALVRKPRALILDEATSALDACAESAVQKALFGSTLENTTALIIAHRLSAIKDADAIVVLDRGVVVEKGTHDTLIAARGAYFALLNGDDF
ncbi:hypothetical protein CTAYLR_002611 [Chrysophaeum taylorii]|uniref:Uncharacterized protein n=1 Tax=Chrysophaeum taylorii TaxID=2483200 RepID=A0AAD7XNY9_9STRA|nr:hypothetical protein CTAYLR_002611 [Chrysophaeum taylorii]